MRRSDFRRCDCSIDRVSNTRRSDGGASGDFSKTGRSSRHSQVPEQQDRHSLSIVSLPQRFRTRISFASNLSISSRPARDKKISGEAFTAGRSATLKLPFQIVEVHDKSVRPLTGQRSEKVSPVHTPRYGSLFLGDLSSLVPVDSGREASRRSRANFSGERRKAEKTSSGNSNVPLGMLVSSRGRVVSFLTVSIILAA